MPHVEGGLKPLFFMMEINSIHINQWAGEAADGTDIFVIDVIHHAARNHFKIVIDADLGVTADKCSTINRFINKKLEDINPEHSLSLEVTSPGAEKPLVNIRQYPKHTGRMLVINLKNGETVKGKLKEIQQEKLFIETGGKKNTIFPVPISEIEKSVIEISF